MSGNLFNDSMPAAEFSDGWSNLHSPETWLPFVVISH
jgi:hypothetical protein